jgi:RNA polymerase sigma-70 factor (ECF subfamily)
VHALTLKAAAATRPLDTVSFGDVHRDHANFVWLSLQRMGVAPSDLDDVFQEVFLVVHRRLETFDGTSKVRTWLYGICLRVASDYRRKAHRRREELREVAPEARDAPSPRTPEEWMAVEQARQRLNRILDAMSVEKRAVFVMFEVDGLSCTEVAEIVDVPVGTVYSRIHAARQEFEAALKRLEAAEARRGLR